MLAILETINEDLGFKLAQLPQSMPHCKWQDTTINDHLLDQFNLSYEVDPELFNDGEDAEHELTDGGSFVEGQEDDPEDFELKDKYNEDDITYLVSKPLVQAPTTKPRGRGCPRKDQVATGVGNAKAMPKGAKSKGTKVPSKQGATAVTESDEESSEAVESDQDLLFWAMLVHTGEATIDRKPARVNAFTNGPHRGTGNSCTNSAPTPNISNLYQLPYGTHPPPHHMMPWVMLPAVHYPQMPIYHLNTMMLPGAPYSDLAGYLKVPQAAAPVIHMPLNVPVMKPWLQSYDNHLAHSSPTQLSNLCSALEAKGFICIDQLDGPGIDVEKIMSWIDVPPGVTLLLYRYAKEDMVLVHARQFSRDTPVASGSQG
ncbi:hypothetical protein BJV74DRAFT_884134 [Russula compacta]|nr:hypothetical protein BJV74DRAFT_884134 [Russula compacta]